MNCFAHLSHNPTGIPNGADVDVVRIVLPLLHRIVSHRYGGVSYMGNPRISHHADNFYVRLRVAEPLSQGTPVREVTAGHGLVNYRDFRRPFGVACVKLTPGEHRHPNRGEILRTHPVAVQQYLLAGSPLISADDDTVHEG